LFSFGKSAAGRLSGLFSVLVLLPSYLLSMCNSVEFDYAGSVGVGLICSVLAGVVLG